jgi:divalent metal cation (Fe/Co/Zn/Cd) transporter
MRRVVQLELINSGCGLRQLGLRLVYATVAWNAAEGAMAVVAGVLARSVSLTAFGLDSSVEVFVSLVAIWQMRRTSSFRSRVGLRLIGGSFLVVALYVTLEAVRRIVAGQHAEASIVGLALTAAAVPIMAGLGVAKRHVARGVHNPVLEAEARFSLTDSALAATVLLGLVLDQTLGWWWADPTVALIIAGLAAREGAGRVRDSLVRDTL